MLVERAVDCTGSGANDEHFKKSKDKSIPEKFLKKHKTAKIIVVLDTHCIDNGFFVWSGTSEDNYRACRLLEVSYWWIYPNNIFSHHPRYSGTVAQWESSNTCQMKMVRQCTTTGALS